MSQDILFIRYTKGIVVTSAIGILLSIYGLYVEISAHNDEDYEAMCDISEHVSCTKVFTSEYATGFGIIGPILGEDSFLNLPNPLYGILFYMTIAALNNSKCIKFSKAQVILSALSNLMSIYLAYLLYFILEDFCIVCVSTYFVNFINLILSSKRYNILREQKIQQILAEEDKKK